MIPPGTIKFFYTINGVAGLISKNHKIIDNDKSKPITYYTISGEMN